MKPRYIALALALASCSSNGTPNPNTAQAQFIASANTIEVKVSDTRPASAGLLIGPDGTTYPATLINVMQTPYQTYNPPPTIGTPCTSASRISSLRRSSDSVTPVGFWKLGSA